jgi:SPP1 family predicted phage head-tail adaptor
MIPTNVQQISPSVRAGQLRHRINILNPILAQDTDGGVNVRNNQIVATVWASVDAISGAEKFAAHEFESQVNYKVVIRWLDGIKQRMRIQWGDRLLLVESVLNPDGRKRMLLLYCLEIGDSANTQMGVGA